MLNPVEMIAGIASRGIKTASTFWPVSMFGSFGGMGTSPRNTGIQYAGPSYGVTPSAPVNFDSAMQISAVWGAVKIISETVGSLPFNIYRITPTGRVIATNHPLHRVFNRKPNRYQTPVEFWESMAMNLAVTGNAYAKKLTVGKRIVGLLPISSSQIVTDLHKDGSVTHTYTSGIGVQVLSSDEVWHVKLMGNGIIGLSPLAYARNAIGIGIATDNRVTKMYSNGAKAAGVLYVSSKLTPEQRAGFKSKYADLAEGNNDSLIVLEEGYKYDQVSMSPKDIEMMDSRRFQIEDIGRFFGVPSILLNQTYGQSSLGSNVYEIVNGFYKIGLRPYLEKFESSVSRWLLSDTDAEEYEVEFDFDALLRADTSTRLQANREAINSAQMTPNEARAREGLTALPGGDQLLIQGAMIPILQAGRDQKL
jgi:HK97 family phage portal protein